MQNLHHRCRGRWSNRYSGQFCSGQTNIVVSAVVVRGLGGQTNIVVSAVVVREVGGQSQMYAIVAQYN